MRFQSLIFAAFIFVAFGCSDSENGSDSNGPDQSALLQNIGDNLILKGYENLKNTTDQLQQSTQTFTEDVSTSNLTDVREKWVKAYTAWQKVAFYNFGPAANNALLTINAYPTDTALVHDNIAAGADNYNLSTAGATFAKGFPALDYLLHGYAEDDNALLDQYQNNDNAKTYLKDVVSDIATLTSDVHNQWSPEGNNYIATFKSNTGTSKGTSLSLMVNAWSEYIEIHVRNAKIGTPNGNSVASSERFGPFPEKSEAYYSKTHTLALAQTAVTALKNFYLGVDANGNDGEGIHDYLNELNAQDGTLADDFKLQFTEVENNLSNLNEPFVDAIEQQGDDVTEVFNSLKAVVALLKVDVVSALSISITYADNDGD